MNILFVGLAVALGWGLRGEIGGEQGALIPGALLGLAIAIASGKKHWLEKAPLLGAGGALGMSLGGIQSYGILIGYTHGIDLLNVTYGYLSLAVVGGLWGAFCAGILGMVLSDRQKSLTFWALFLVAIYISAQISYFILIKVLKLLMTPPRVENWALVLGAVVALFVINFIQKEHKTCRLVLRGFFAGAIGFMFGELLQVLGRFLGPEFDWWKVMEISFGFVLGIGIAYAVFREYEEDKPIMNITPFFYVMAVFIILSFVPMITLHNLLERFEENQILIRNDTRWLDPYFNVMLRGIALTLISFTIYWKWFKETKVENTSLGQLQFFWLWTIWTNGWITQILIMIPKTSLFPVRIHAFFLFIMILISIWSILVKFPAPSFPSWLKPVQGYKWVVVSLLLVPILAILFAIMSLASHPGKPPDKLQRRFEWNTSSMQSQPSQEEQALEAYLSVLSTTRTTNNTVFL